MACRCDLQTNQGPSPRLGLLCKARTSASSCTFGVGQGWGCAGSKLHGGSWGRTPAVHGGLGVGRGGPGLQTGRRKPREGKALPSATQHVAKVRPPCGPCSLPSWLLSLLLLSVSSTPGAASSSSWWFPGPPWLQLGIYLLPPQARRPGPGARRAGGGGARPAPSASRQGSSAPSPPPLIPLMKEEEGERVSEIIYTRTYKN